MDIDNTLYSYQDSHDCAINACYDLFKKQNIKELSKEVFRKLYREKRNEVTERLKPQGACRSRLFAFVSFFEDLSSPNAYLSALKFEEQYWESFINSLDPSKEIINYLESCKNSGISICAVSDMQAHIQIKKLEKLNADKFIDFLVTSEEVGFEKPNKEIFELSLKKMNLEKDQVIMIGDSLEKDVIGAKNFGIKGYRFEA